MLAALLSGFTVEQTGAAVETTVPAEIQVELLSKLSSYDRSFAARAGEVARILILVKTGSSRSDLAAATLTGALARAPRFGGLPHSEAVVPYQSAVVLAKRCREERIAVVYVAPGLESEIERLRSAMTGVDVLTVAAMTEYVEGGVVLGFELRSGKPKMLINYAQAKRQNIDFPAAVLKLMRVVSR